MSGFEPSRLVEVLLRHSKRPTSFPTEGLIRLASGDPDFDTPEHIQEALFEAVRSGATHYSQPLGEEELRGALAESVTKRSAHSYGLDQIVVTHGASAALGATILSCVHPGDRVVIPQPTYSLYADQVRMAGGEPVFLGLEKDFHLDLDQLQDALPGARMLVLCNPCNPTGVAYRSDEMKAIARMASENNVLVLADEVYDHIVFEGFQHSSTLELEELGDLLIYCQSFSKTHAMTGWRIGYLAAPAEIARAAGRLHFAFASTLNPGVQRAALIAATVDSDHPARMLSAYQSRRQIVLDRLSEMEGVQVRPPEATFYAFLKYPQAVGSLEMAGRALEAGVSVRAGVEFGKAGEGYLRVSFTARESDLVEGLDRLATVIA
ncbi:MAG: pyridoxal phosphate-dependent aminotransferase [Actinomycetota bacterium]